MSEYQYYEFRAVDRPLGEREMRVLRALSTRAAITPTSFVNTYNWGDFRGDPALLMEKYFDAFVYVANWGTRQFMLRLPRRLLDAGTASLYSAGGSAAVRTKREFLVLEFRSEREGGDWEEGEAWLPSLLPLREDLLRGDLRSLYLGWLLGADAGDLDDDAIEPPPPPGLGNLSAPLKSFASFLRIDGDLIEAAAEAGAGPEKAGLSRRELAAWMSALPEAEKNAMLVRLAAGNDPHLHAELWQRFRQSNASVARPTGDSAGRRRTVAQLLAAAKERADQRRRRAAEREARERARREREQAIARANYLEDLARREADAWRQVDALIETRRPIDYDQAVQLLKDLLEVGVRIERRAEFESRLRQLHERHSKKSSLLRRFAKAGLGTTSGPVT